MTAVNEGVAHRDSPYFGLDYYGEEFGAWFFGRDVERGQIITNLQAARLTLLHAESGVGKSSLLRAGVAWRLSQLAADGGAARGASMDIPVVISSWKDDPVATLIGEIQSAIKPFLRHSPETQLPAGLDAAIQTATDMVASATEITSATLLIMLDQFEEYFLYCAREPQPEHFADELARCINQARFPANFLISIREDAYAGLGDLFNGRVANLYGNYLHIDYLDRVAAEKAIREPLEVYNRQPGVTSPVEIEDKLVEAVLDQVRAYDANDRPAQVEAGVAADGRVATPLLQLVMATVWDKERAARSAQLRLSTLQSLEGVSKVADSHLRTALHALGGGERETAIDVFDHLVTPSGGKIAESIPDLAARTGHTEEQVGLVLEKLDRARIVRPVPAPPDQDARRFRRYEIFHDVLAPTINRAIATRDEQRRTRRVRRLAVLALGLLVVVATIGIVIGYLYSTANAERQTANTERQVAQSRQLAAAADQKLGTDPELSALLALQALRVHYTSQAENALRQALPDIQEVRELDNESPVVSAAFDPADHGKVVSSGESGDSWVWSVPTGRRLLRLRPNGGFARNGTADAMAFNPNGTQVAVGYGGGTLAVFSASSGREQRLVRTAGAVTKVTYVDDSLLAVATSRGAYLGRPGSPWHHLQSGTQGGLHTAHQYTYSVAADPVDPRKFAVAGEYGTDICKLGVGAAVRCRPLVQGLFTDVEFSPDGRELLTVGDHGSVRLYNANTRTLIRYVGVGAGYATTAQFNRAGTRIVVGYTSGVARVWNPHNGVPVAELAGNSARVNAVGFDADGREIVTASEDGTTRVWQTQPQGLQPEFSASETGSMPNPAYDAAYSPGGTRLVIVDSSGKAYFDSTSGRRLTVFSGVGRIYSASFSPNGKKIVTATGGGYVDQWQAMTPNRPIPARGGIILGANASAVNAHYSPDSTRLVVITTNHSAQVFNATTSKRLFTLNPRDFVPMSAAVFRPGGRQILTADQSGRVEVWNATNGTKIRILIERSPPITDLEFNRSGSAFVTAAVNGEVTVWTAGRYHRALQFDACSSPNSASFSPNAREIVVSCSDGTARVFATVTGKLLTVINAAPGGLVNSAAFSPDGKSIVVTFDVFGTGGVEIWSSQLATSSLPALEKLAQHRVDATLGRAERASGLATVNGF